MCMKSCVFKGGRTKKILSLTKKLDSTSEFIVFFILSAVKDRHIKKIMKEQCLLLHFEFFVNLKLKESK